MAAFNNRWPSGRTGGRNGFSLVELLLVTALLMIATGLAVPAFMRSYRGATLRTSARTLVMAARYARAAAVLGQAPTAIYFDRVHPGVEVVVLQEDPATIRGGSLLGDGHRPLQERDEPAANGMSLKPRLRRRLADGVRFVRLEGLEGGREASDMFWTLYQPNGMTRDYRLVIEDRDGQRAEVSVSGLSGRPEVKYP